jgi:Xaa-Pro aminopeptidase
VSGSIGLDEFHARRQRVLHALDGAASVVFAGEGSAPLLGKWRPDRYFLYLTGITTESGAAILFDPSAEDEDKRVCLFLRPQNPEVDQWDGFRAGVGEKLKAETGFSHVGRTNALPGFLTGAARRTKKLACLHPFSVYPAPVSPDLAVYRQVSERVPGVAIEDKTRLLPEMRAVKSPAEIEATRRAVAATVDGYQTALQTIRVGVTERTVAEAMEQAFRKHGGEHAYNPIVGTAGNAAVLHYMENRATLQDGDLLLVDAGAMVDGYAADVTRVFPVNGKFTPEQRRLYEAVLQAEEAAITQARPGVALHLLDQAARNVLRERGFPDGYPHGLGHPLGLDVHDVSPDTVLRAGMVVTIEPGLYLPEQNIGIRIEDDLLVTEAGAENLTIAIPKSVEAVEQALQSAKT